MPCVCTTLCRVSSYHFIMHLNIDIKKYILDKYNPAKLVEPTLEVFYKSSNEKFEGNFTTEHGQLKCPILFPFACTTLASVPIKEVCTLIKVDGHKAKRVLEITLDIENAFDIDYEPGDTIGILPNNPKIEVEQMLHALNLLEKSHHNCQIQVKRSCTKRNAKVPAHIPQITTPIELLRDCLNLHAVLKKQFLRILGECCTDVDERNFLNCLSSKEANSHYNKLILEQGVTLLDLLQLCPTCKPTLEMLLENLPRLLPRPYSIANSPLTRSNEIKIMLSILAENPGVTTSMLDYLATKLKQNTIEAPPRVLMYFRLPNNFRYTDDDAACNQILITIGTGLAPFIGFLEHKEHLSRSQSIELGQTWLYAGAATEDSMLHRNRLLEWQGQGVLNKYLESFSRQPEASYRYVQELVQANACEFVQFFLQHDTLLYVCADGSQISKSIEAAISACLEQELGLQPMEAKEMINEFRLSGKYREDLWI